MSTFALPGGRGPVCPDLPPTLLPRAVTASAPPRERLRSLAMASLVYLLLAGGGILASRVRTPTALAPVKPTEPPPKLFEWDLRRPVPEPAPLVRSAGPVSTGEALPGPRAASVPPLVLDPTSVPRGLPTTDPSGLRPAGGGTGLTPTGVQVPGLASGGSGLVREIDVRSLRILHQVSPVYPAMARLMHLQGVVVLQMTIDEHGIPTKVQVLQGHPAFREEAVRAARLWRFEPTLVEGRAVPATFQLTLDFRLQ